MCVPQKLSGLWSARNPALFSVASTVPQPSRLVWDFSHAFFRSEHMDTFCLRRIRLGVALFLVAFTILVVAVSLFGSLQSHYLSIIGDGWRLGWTNGEGCVQLEYSSYSAYQSKGNLTIVWGAYHSAPYRFHPYDSFLFFATERINVGSRGAIVSTYVRIPYWLPVVLLLGLATLLEHRRLLNRWFNRGHSFRFTGRGGVPRRLPPRRSPSAIDE
jgi:hypothetical protein